MSKADDDKIVGVIGGLGSQATADFFQRIISYTDAGSDQEHLHIIIDNNPKTPNRNQAIAGTGPSPANDLAKGAQRLEQAGADFLVMPCNTAHAFAESITGSISIPFLSIIDQVRDYILEAHPEVRKIGLLAVDGCLQSGLYDSVLAARGLELVVLSEQDQARFMDLVYEIKARGVNDSVTGDMLEMASDLIHRGSEILLAGCTEVPLVLSSDNVSVPFIDSTELLARRTVEYARGL